MRARRLRQRTLYFERIRGITARAFIAEHCGETEEPAGERPDDEPEPSTRETAEAALAAGRGDSAPATEGMRKALSLAAAMGEVRARPARARARNLRSCERPALSVRPSRGCTTQRSPTAT